MAGIADKFKSSETDATQGQERVVPVEERMEGLKNDSQALSAKETLSAYFTIAAAAFGLISDGCKHSTYSYRHHG